MPQQCNGLSGENGSGGTLVVNRRSAPVTAAIGEQPAADPQAPEEYVMKTAAFAIALMMSGAAIAGGDKTTTAAQDPVDHSTMDHSNMSATASAEGTMSAANNDSAMSGSATSSMTTQTTLAMAPAGDPVAEPSNANPERDARGIPVISASAKVPDGYNGVSGTAVGGPMLDPATGAELSDQSIYPACTASLTDNCVQTYERGRSS
jgi:hypothetical protein